MSDVVSTWTREDALREGEAFGRLAGQRAAAAMTRADASEAMVQALGRDAVASVLETGGRLADAGLSRELVEAWTDAAAEAFNLELERAAALLSASGTRH